MKKTKLVTLIVCSSMMVLMLASCAQKNGSAEGEKNTTAINEAIQEYLISPLEVEVNPENLEISVKGDGQSVVEIDLPDGYEVSDFASEGNVVEWTYDEKVEVIVSNKDDYILLSLQGIHENDNSFTLPLQSGEAYYIPFGEGKHISADDGAWKEHLDNREYSTLEGLSMPFIAVDNGDNAVLYIIENPYRTELRFFTDPDLQVELINQFENIDDKKLNNIRIYVTKNNPVAIAKVYKSYVTETRGFVTLHEKAKITPNIEKLFGAPHIYLWGEFLLSNNDVNWQNLRQKINSNIFAHIGEVASQSEHDIAFDDVAKEIMLQDYVNEYQKSVILRALSLSLQGEDFYNEELLSKKNLQMEALLAKGRENLHPAEIIELNKQALFENTEGIFNDVAQWYNYDSVDILNEMKDIGIENAWIGLNSLELAYSKPQLAEIAVKNGYLIAPYDSYHSIHEPGKEQWITAKFTDSQLYENATVTDKNGEKNKGFQGVGRKLNPTLAFPAVKERVDTIMASGVQFNSWFVDCDATGEVYDDYTLENITTKQEDIVARLERMAYLENKKGFVVGSEGGNDFAANTIAFAHGIELQTFSWMDKDMTDKNSEYYLGRYYAQNGGVADKLAKPVPIKEKYRTLFLNMAYDVPLYKLVYNDSVITSYHWDWSTFKMRDEVKNRMLREILYNVPPMYHLDRTEWETYKDVIGVHTTIWSEFSRKAILEEMTNFEVLGNDKLVQLAEYGDQLKAIANFSDTDFTHQSTIVPAHSILISIGGKDAIYTP